MIGTECNLGLAYLCLTDYDEDNIILSEDLNNAKWIEGIELTPTGMVPQYYHHTTFRL